MAPPSWLSDIRRLFCESYLPEYAECRAKKKYKPFWLKLFAGYIGTFPLVDDLFPDRKLGELNEDEMKEYSVALAKLQKRLKEWFRWQFNPRSRNSAVAVSPKLLKEIYSPRTRGLKVYETFAKLYPEQVTMALDERCEKDGIGGSMKISRWHTVCKALYEAATEDEILAVETRMADDAEDEEEEEAGTPESFQRYLTSLPSVLSALVDPAARKAGVLALVTIVGPEPESDGNIKVHTLQFGDKEKTPLFAATWNEYERVFVTAVSQFAKRHEFSMEVCAQRALKKGPDSQDPTVSPSVDQPGAQSTPVTTSTAPDTASSASSTSSASSASSASAASAASPASSASSAAAFASGMAPLAPSLPSVATQSSISLSDVASNRVSSSSALLSQTINSNLQDEGHHNPDLFRYSLPSGPPVNVGYGSNWSDVNFVPDRNLIQSPTSNEVTWNPQLDVPEDHPWGGYSNNTFTAVAGDSNPASMRASAADLPTFSDNIGFPYTPLSLSTSMSTYQNLYPTNYSDTGPSHNGILPPVPDETYRSHTQPLPPAPTHIDEISHTQPLSPAPTVRRNDEIDKPESALDNALKQWNIAAKNYKSRTSNSSVFGTSYDPSSSGNPATNPPTATSASLAVTGILSGPISNPVTDTVSTTATSPNPSQPIATAVPSAPSQPTTTTVTSPKPSQPIADAIPSAPCQPTTNMNPSTIPAPVSVTTNTASTTATPRIPSEPTRNVNPNAIPASVPATNTASTAATHPTPAQPAPEPNARTNPATSTSSQTVVDSESAHTAETDGIRRSGRASKPSTQREKLQLIGTNVPQMAIPSNDAPKDPDAVPSWFVATIADFMKVDLGSEWLGLVDQWSILERLLGYGMSMKGSLPVQDRPNEWNKWTAKSAQGVRNHEASPFIDDPAEIGIAITKWWNRSQPAFRRNPTGDLPTPVYDDPGSECTTWSPLCKSGPNGFVSLLMLTLWWGRAAAPGPGSYREDSRGAWKDLVTDVTSCLKVLVSVAPTLMSRGTKRRGENLASKSVSKRNRK